MISDRNHVDLEGEIYETPEIYETEGKKVINFVVRNVHISPSGEEDEQLYNCVVWNKNVERYGEKITKGTFVRIEGHLQNNVLSLDGGKKFRYAKVCVDRLEADD